MLPAAVAGGWLRFRVTLPAGAFVSYSDHLRMHSR